MNINLVKFLKTFFTAAAAGFLIYSCSKKYLDKEALALLDENVLANNKGVETLLIGAYSLLDGISYAEGSDYNNDHFGSACSNWIYGSICGSEAYQGGSGLNEQDGEVLALEIFNPLAGNAFLAAKWRAVYDGIQRSNDVLRIMKKAKDITPENEKRIAAEARFLRAHYHFEAKKIWNNVPFVDETISYANNNYHVTNQDSIWPYVENDLIYAVENLNEIPYGGAFGRANKNIARALLAKAYLFQEKFAKAKPLLEAIITSGKYKLDTSYADNFNPAKKNYPESVFSVQMSVNDGSKGFNGNYGDVLNFPAGFFIGSQPGWCCGFFQPSQYLVNHFKTDPSGLPEFITFNIVDIKNDQNILSASPFTPHSGTLDPRLDWTVGRRGIPYLDWGNHPGKDWIADPLVQFGPYTPKKNVYYKSQENTLTDNNFWGGGASGATANNVNLIRYADVLLWAAEVEVEIGDLNKARDYVNQVRKRAADSSGWVKKADGTPAANYKVSEYKNSWADQTYARNAVRFERMLELGMEGHRFFDLVRWGIADIEIKAYLDKEKIKRNYMNGAVFTKGKNEYFPIPQIQIDLSAGADGVPKMKQNPGY